MAEQLEQLLQRIQDEAIAKADTAAQQRMTAAEQRAAAIIAAAEQRATQLVATAEQRAQQLQASGTTALQQAARDVLIYLRQAIMQHFDALCKQALPEVAPVAVIQEILIKLATFAAQQQRDPQGVRVFVSEADQKKLVDFFMHRFREEVQRGTELHPMPGIKAGFKISLSDRDVLYDFSDGALVELLSALVNPALAEILQQAVKKQ